MVAAALMCAPALFLSKVVLSEPTRDSPAAVAGIDFGFSTNGEVSLNGPSAVYTDGRSTFFQLRREITPEVYRHAKTDPAIPVTREGLLLKALDVGSTFLLVWPDASVEITKKASLPSAMATATSEADLPKSAAAPTLASSSAKVLATEIVASIPALTTPAAMPLVPPSAIASPAGDALTTQAPTLQPTVEVAWVKFSVTNDQALSASLRAALQGSPWTDIVWDVPDDFVVHHGYSVVGIDLPDLFGKILRPFGLDARFHRGNRLVHIFVRGAKQ